MHYLKWLITKQESNIRIQVVLASINSSLFKFRNSEKRSACWGFDTI